MEEKSKMDKNQLEGLFFGGIVVFPAGRRGQRAWDEISDADELSEHSVDGEVLFL